MRKAEIMVIGALATVGIAIAYYVAKNAKAAGTAIGGAAVDFTDGVVSGAVNGVGSMVGVPMTNLTECQRAKIEGRTWDASFACPASDFLKYVFN